jgi:hypothetical protein
MMTIAGEIEKALTDCVNDIRRRSTQAGQVATGRTLRALEVRVRNEGAAIVGEIWGRPFTGALETGSRPARRKGTAAARKAMVADMKEWCRIRGLTDGMTDKQAENFARWLSWYIKRYGSALYRKGGRRDIITPAVEATKNELAERLGAYYEQQLTYDINNKFFG